MGQVRFFPDEDRMRRAILFVLSQPLDEDPKFFDPETLPEGYLGEREDEGDVPEANGILSRLEIQEAMAKTLG
ncbi:MAG: hypothetical protein AB1500_11950 [Bacillota bacterium]